MPTNLNTGRVMNNTAIGGKPIVEISRVTSRYRERRATARRSIHRAIVGQRSRSQYPVQAHTSNINVVEDRSLHLQ